MGLSIPPSPWTRRSAGGWHALIRNSSPVISPIRWILTEMTSPVWTTRPFAADGRKSMSSGVPCTPEPVPESCATPAQWPWSCTALFRFALTPITPGNTRGSFIWPPSQAARSMPICATACAALKKMSCGNRCTRSSGLQRRSIPRTDSRPSPFPCARAPPI